MTAPLLLIVARDSEGGIGRDGDLPWHIPTDLKFFQETTRITREPGTRNAVIMGRKTWESIPERYRPLKGRLNIVVSRNENYDTGGDSPVFNGLDKAIEWARSQKDIECVFVVGGGMLYGEVLKREDLNAAWITEIEGSFGCDTFFPPLPQSFIAKEDRGILVENEVSFRFVRYESPGAAS